MTHSYSHTPSGTTGDRGGGVNPSAPQVPHLRTPPHRAVLDPQGQAARRHGLSPAGCLLLPL